MTLSAPLKRLCAALAQLEWIEEDGLATRAVQDYSWFSPILTQQLAGRRAEVAVRPRSVEELQALAAGCARERVALTLRGSGTGNYGQCTPLHGGVLVDMTALNQVRWVRDGASAPRPARGWVPSRRRRARQGLELRALPPPSAAPPWAACMAAASAAWARSTTGPLGAAGNILGVQVLPLADPAEAVELRGADAVALHRLWGTTGIALEVELALAPAQPWVEVVATFADRDATLAFADRLAQAPGLVKRNVCVLLQPVPGLLARLADVLPPGEHAVLAVVSAVSEPAVAALLAEHAGTLRLRQDEEQVRRSHRSIVEFCWNHTTLHALKTDPGLTYLQNSFTAGVHLQQLAHAGHAAGRRGAVAPGIHPQL
jgi:FAD/FMN-containing dehydrogenase